MCYRSIDDTKEYFSLCEYLAKYLWWQSIPNSRLLFPPFTIRHLLRLHGSFQISYSIKTDSKAFNKSISIESIELLAFSHRMSIVTSIKRQCLSELFDFWLFSLYFSFISPVWLVCVPISIRIPIFKCAISQTSFLSLDSTFGFAIESCVHCYFGRSR